MQVHGSKPVEDLAETPGFCFPAQANVLIVSLWLLHLDLAAIVSSSIT